jgi:hypothetical protein
LRASRMKPVIATEDHNAVSADAIFVLFATG